MYEEQICIVVPLHKNKLNDYERLSLSTIQKHFNKEKKFLVTYKENNIEIDNFQRIHFDKTNFQNIDTYNKLCLSLEFYKKFTKYKYMLICQLDVLILNNKINKFLKYNLSYIGAPTGRKNPFDRSRKKLWARKFFCNGGFSLRKIKDFINVLESNKMNFPVNKFIITECMKSGFVKYLSLYYKTLLSNERFKGHFFAQNLYVKEDSFWTYFANLFIKDFKMPNLNQCTSFGFDGDPEFYYSRNNKDLPMALHGDHEYLKFLKKINYNF